jgi:hypothetical protein
MDRLQKPSNSEVSSCSRGLILDPEDRDSKFHENVDGPVATTRRHMPQASTLHSHQRENLRLEMSSVFSCLDNRLTDGGKVVSLTRRPLFTPRNQLVIISVRC